jgi:hypothetical protein
MPGRQLWTLKQTCLGRQGPEGGVVLGLHPDYDDFMHISNIIIYFDMFYTYVCIRF